MMKRNAFWGLLAVGMTVVLTGEVNAQWNVSKEGFLGEFRKKSIIGSWEELVRFPAGVRPVKVVCHSIRIQQKVPY
jgi:hypothetical protein